MVVIWGTISFKPVLPCLSYAKRNLTLAAAVLVTVRVVVVASIKPHSLEQADGSKVVGKAASGAGMVTVMAESAAVARRCNSTSCGGKESTTCVDVESQLDGAASVGEGDGRDGSRGFVSEKERNNRTRRTTLALWLTLWCESQCEALRGR